MKIIATLSFIIACLQAVTAMSATTIKPWKEPTQTVHRDSFNTAKLALQAGDVDLFKILLESLEPYPLHYYLQSLYLEKYLHTEPQTVVRTYLNQEQHSIFGKNLLRDWLYHLAREKQWKTFLADYRPQHSVALQCYYQIANHQLHGKSQKILTAAKNLWMSKKSRPNQCNPLFELLYDNNIITDKLLWQRISLIMDTKKTRLAAVLAKKLSDERLKTLFEHWQKIRKNPQQQLKKIKRKDEVVVRQIIAYGIKRLAKKNLNSALKLWPDLNQRYAFTVKETANIQRSIALQAMEQNHAEAKTWLNLAKVKGRNHDLTLAQIKLAFIQQDWISLLEGIQNLPKKERRQLKWQYWQARGLSQTGNTTVATQLFKKIAKERDYYGFLAADQVNANYQLADKRVAYQKQQLQKLLTEQPVFFRIKEFLAIGMTKIAQREWWHLMKTLPTAERGLAAVQARQYQWYNFAIYAAHKAKKYDDTYIRFPTPFYQKIKDNAKIQNIPSAWVYGIIRQESAFASLVSSHVGAMGLMQLMPATGRAVAKKIGLNLTSKQDIYTIDNNLRLGSAYLQQMLKRFDNNPLLASAAYNAGPGRVKRWLKQNACVPADIWVELIPFKETRRYVRKVLSYSNIYNLKLPEKTNKMRLSTMQFNPCETP